LMKRLMVRFLYQEVDGLIPWSRDWLFDSLVKRLIDQSLGQKVNKSIPWLRGWEIDPLVKTLMDRSLGQEIERSIPWPRGWCLIPWSRGWCFDSVIKRLRDRSLGQDVDRPISWSRGREIDPLAKRLKDRSLDWWLPNTLYLPQVRKRSASSDVWWWFGWNGMKTKKETKSVRLAAASCSIPVRVVFSSEPGGGWKRLFLCNVIVEPVSP